MPASERPPQSKLPRGAGRLMLAMLAVLGIVSVVANIQRTDRAKHEKTTITYLSPTPSPTPQLQ